MRYFLLLLFLGLVAPCAYAQEGNDVATLEALCKKVNHPAISAQDSAEYVSGVDVNGNAVVPADLPSNNNTFMTSPIVLPLDLDVAERYGLDLPAGIEIIPNLAQISIYGDGRIVFEDEDVSDVVNSFCENYDPQMKKNQSNQEEQHGHESANPVLSSDKIEGQYP